ncbi:G-TYPE LECTIN S-RECEPTOR-LIKE SERINE/THREONINE-PROTEIN KINASE RLK1 [Salix koriyanagi]|uniref:G-TYPE LECTIN S-RECEPTOR-LIKE SERINE/THREONINE-PROTEIN KINASE RLK1 n=1 Tax=Salix koriyanagi TaxID=2511006 RepID=A0A9Q0PUN0_9ROSI|nr:G-TYPE LECTIN S-RECEPTOR-LIKE SERINE/THREONINE-PROTEIN KINASE RLK1 [Salix koriyanagi]
MGRLSSNFRKVLFLWIGLLFRFLEIKKKPDTKLITGSVVLGGSCLETNLRYFSYKELAEATNDFKDEVGRGGFGVVYKGTIQAGSTKVVAVKKLDRVVQDGEKAFKTEVQVIGQTHHKNLARRSVDLEVGEAENPLLTDWAYDCYVNGTLDVLIGDDTEAMNDMSTLERLLKVGIWCIQEEPSLRPTMRKVTQMLEGVIEVPAAPNPCPYSTFSNYDQ